MVKPIMKQNMSEKFYITTPIYYVNDKPHIGHAYTTVAADALARFHRLKGEEVFFLTGTDEHGSKVAQSAEKAGMSPQEFCDINSATFQFAWDRLDISNDFFIRTTSDYHKKGVEKFLEKLQASGAIYEGEYEGLYCTGCEKFITEKELVDGKCPDHKITPEIVKEKNYFFNLKKYLPQIEKCIDSGEIKIMPETRRREVLGLFKQDLNDFSISRENVKWGIPLPFHKDQVAYVWVDALMNYVTALGFGQDEEKYQKFWPADIHLMAKDIIKFHAVFWPALLLAIGEKLPKVIFTHGFFTIDGEKMSKSLGNVIDPNMLVDEFGSDSARYLLLSQFPFGQDGDIKAGNFAIQYNADLANGVGNFSSRVLAMAEKYFQGVVPQQNDELASQVADLWQQYEAAFADFAVDKAIECIKKITALGDGYVETNKPWELAKTNPERLAEVLYNLIEVVRHTGLMIYPIMPQTSEKIMAAVGKNDFLQNQFIEMQKWAGMRAGDTVTKPESLFPRLSK